MARGINKVILVGNLGNDPETKYTQGGMAVTTISLATTSVRKDRDGNNQERTEWHRVKLFGKLGEIAGEYLKKGSKVYVEGSLHTRKWQDKQTGQDRYSTEIKANTMQMLDSRGQGGGQGGGGFAGGQSGGYDGGNDFAGGGSFPSYEDFDQGASAAPARAPQQRPQGAPQGQPRPAQAPADDFDDDIPF